MSAGGGYRCACGDVWPDASYGCGHTPTRCEGSEGYGLFDPYAFTTDSAGPVRPDEEPTA